MGSILAYTILFSTAGLYHIKAAFGPNRSAPLLFWGLGGSKMLKKKNQFRREKFEFCLRGLWKECATKGRNHKKLDEN